MFLKLECNFLCHGCYRDYICACQVQGQLSPVVYQEVLVHFMLIFY